MPSIKRDTPPLRCTMDDPQAPPWLGSSHPDCPMDRASWVHNADRKLCPCSSKRPRLATDKSLKLAISLTLHTKYGIPYPPRTVYHHLSSLGSLDFSPYLQECNDVAYAISTRVNP